MKKYLLSLVILTLIAGSGCQQKGGGEKAGERFDEVIDNIKDGDSPLKKKGTMEKVGEAIDETVPSRR